MMGKVVRSTMNREKIPKVESIFTFDDLMKDIS